MSSSLKAPFFTIFVRTALTLAHKHLLHGPRYQTMPEVNFRFADLELSPDVQFGGKYTIYKTQLGSNKRVKVATVPISHPPAPAWNHDFPVTQHYAIIPETPVSINPKVPHRHGTLPEATFSSLRPLQLILSLRVDTLLKRPAVSSSRSCCDHRLSRWEAALRLL